MNDIQAIEMMTRCKSEILQLRHTIERLAPKAQAWDYLCTVLDLLPRQSQGGGEDLAWRLDNEIERLREAQSEPRPMNSVED